MHPSNSDTKCPSEVFGASNVDHKRIYIYSIREKLNTKLTSTIMSRTTFEFFVYLPGQLQLGSQIKKELFN